MFFGFYFFDVVKEECELLTQIISLYRKNIVLISYIACGNYEIIIDKKNLGYPDIEDIETESLKEYLPELNNLKDWNIIRYIPENEIRLIRQQMETVYINKYVPRLFIYSDFDLLNFDFIFDENIAKVLNIVKKFNNNENLNEIREWNRHYINLYRNNYRTFIFYCLLKYQSD